MRKNFIIWLARLLRVPMQPLCSPTKRVDYADRHTCSVEKLMVEVQLGTNMDISSESIRRQLCMELASELFKQPSLFRTHKSGYGQTLLRDNSTIFHYNTFSGTIEIVRRNETSNH